jgi:signal transduction histidine kinase
VKTRGGEIRRITWSNTHIRHAQEPDGFIIKTGIDVTERRRLEEQILEISGREQRRIGQDLHDGLGQHLTGIELMLQYLEQTLSSKKRPEAEQAAKISEYVRAAIRQTKNLARGLAPVELERNGLMAALKQLCASTAEICRIRCRFDCPEQIPVENNSVAIQLYRIAQEAVNNSVRHGRATEVLVRLARLPDGHRAVLEIQDNGGGFDPGRAQRGMGLEIMRYRASVINARLEIASRPGAGTRVECCFKTDP